MPKERVNNHMGIHTYKSGGMSDCFTDEKRDVQYNLIVGTNADRDYLRFEVKHIKNTNEKYHGVSLTPAMAKELIKSLKAMGFDK